MTCKANELTGFYRMGTLTVSRLQKQPSEVFCKKDVLKNLAIFTGKKPVLKSLFNKAAGLQA